MSKFYEEAVKKLKKEAESGKFDKYGSAMKSAVVKALTDFCRQSEVFAEAVAHGKSFEECMKEVARGVKSGSISDLEAYKRAVKYFMPGEDVRFCMEITVGEKPEAKQPEQTAAEDVPTAVPAAKKKAEIIDLSAFL